MALKPEKILISFAVCFVLLLVATVMLLMRWMWVFWLLIGGIVVGFCLPWSWLHEVTLEHSTGIKKVMIFAVALVTVAGCVLPMGSMPIWNGEIPGHRNQYELMAEAILDGRIDFAYGDEDQLAELENPYDPNERKEAGVSYHWDHAYYNGKYYMYFGIVPVFLTFLPYRLLTGTALTTYHATQVFTAVTIAGIFALFYLLSKLFFKKLSMGVYLGLSVAFSVMSVWYASAEPALYCTAITAALALEVWSIFFFVRAVWGDGTENRKILFASIGALLGALVFGCRPPIALANLLVIPMLYVFLRQRKFSWKLLGKLALAALPYAAVAAALMTYNYLRFDDPFEFGQAYQLTVADQSNYRIVLNAKTILRILNDTSANLFERADLTEKFPFLKLGGVYYNFPILLLTAVSCKTAVRGRLKQHRLTPLLTGLLITMLVISALDILWTPYLLERYHMDIYFLAGIACFLAVGLWLESAEAKARRRIGAVVMILATMTVAASYLYAMRTTAVYYADYVEKVGNLLTGG